MMKRLAGMYSNISFKKQFLRTHWYNTNFLRIYFFGIEHKAKYQRKMIHLPRLAPVFGHVEELNLSDNNFTWFDHEEEDEDKDKDQSEDDKMTTIGIKWNTL